MASPPLKRVNSSRDNGDQQQQQQERLQHEQQQQLNPDYDLKRNNAHIIQIVLTSKISKHLHHAAVGTQIHEVASGNSIFYPWLS